MIENKTLAAALAAADENSLTALANKGLYKRACKDTEGLTAEYTEAEGAAVIPVGDERCIIRVPLEKSSCTCLSRTVCRHILGAVLLLKKEVPEDFQPEASPVPEPKPEQESEPELEQVPEPEPCPEKPVLLSEKETAAVRECARQTLKQLGGLLARGLIRADASAAEELELAAVQAHAVKMADAERALRNLSAMLSESAERRASFNAAAFTRLLCSCADMLKNLDKPGITVKELGAFRSEYEDYPGTLVLLPIGHREHRGGTYEGNVYYFFNMDEKAPEPFLTYSDLRPAFYGYSRRRLPKSTVWGLGVPLMNMMESRMTLVGAKLCGIKLSGSNSTRVAASGKANIDCPQMRRAAVRDYRELAQGLKNAEERLFLIRIASLAGFGFNKYSQHFRMTVRDENGRSVGIYVKYRPDTKDIIETLEKICRRIRREDGSWAALVRARMSGGRVVLDPIEFYDCIGEDGRHDFIPDSPADPENAYCAGKLIKIIAELEDALTRTVRSGLGSVQEDRTELIRLLRNSGMTSLAGLAEECFAAAEHYRHRMEEGAEEALLKTSALMRYVTAAKNKLDLISAVCNMENGAEEEQTEKEDNE